MARFLVVVAVLLGCGALALGVRSMVASDSPPPTGTADPGVPGEPGARLPSAAGSIALEWAVLEAYAYEPGLGNLPDDVKALEGKRVTMRGFLLPLYEFDDIHEFTLVPTPARGGIFPVLISEVIQVNMPRAAKGLPNTGEPLRVEGTFRVVETKEQGYILSIFRIDDAEVTVVPRK